MGTMVPWRFASLSAFLIFGGCGSSDDSSGSDAPDAGADVAKSPDADAGYETSDSIAPDAPLGCPAPAEPEVLTFTLTHAAFPGSGHPDVAVHVPPGFDACNHPSLVAFFHGFDNCVTTAIGAVDVECTPGGEARTALHLAEQFDAAKVNAVLVAVELVFDEASGDPGNLASPGEFQAMLSEILSDHLTPLIGTPLSLDSLDRIVLASHSGGYRAVASALDVGGVQIDEVELFDSLYGEKPSYASWVETNITRFDRAAPSPMRFSNVFTSAGGTQALSETFEAEVEDALAQAGLSSSLFYQAETAPTPTAADLAHPVFFKHSELSHVDVPRYYFERLMTASDIVKVP
jgi:hypothetical protein